MTATLPPDYETRVYAGILGKLIGVYLGRPFEGWSSEAITRRWGEIRRYVHADQGAPLVVTDDDITGTFAFLRALPDHGMAADLSAWQIGETWLNYIAENQHILWWGGMGMSTEHTAFLRLKAGVPAPLSGSAETNGLAVAEEIGAQIFIDGWALVSPNNPAQAARLATEAARVSHDGEAVHGAVVVAVMESLAFGESDLRTLVKRALEFIPRDCEIARMIGDLIRWRGLHTDWRKTLELLVRDYGYHRFGTNCPMVTNHGVIHLALLYGEGDFDRSLMIANTAGLDTDCNSGNVGCLLGIRNGLAALDAGYDWRTPVNDRLYLPSADGHWGVLDASNLALRVAAIGRALAGQEEREGKPRYSFPFAGSTHGFSPSSLCPLEGKAKAVPGGIGMRILATGIRADVEVSTFIPPDALTMRGYAVTANPTLYPGQVLRASVDAPSTNSAPVRARLFVRTYGGAPEGAGLLLEEGPATEVSPGGTVEMTWVVPDSGGCPIAKAGVSMEGEGGSDLVLREMDWKGTPQATFSLPASIRSDWNHTENPFHRSFQGDIDRFTCQRHRSFLLSQSRGRGLLHTGAEDWGDYRVAATLKPFLAAEFGIAARVQGLRRFYGFTLQAGGRARLFLRLHSEEVDLAVTEYAWQYRQSVRMELALRGRVLTGWIDGKPIMEAEDLGQALCCGGIGFLLTEGRIESESIKVGPL